MAWPPGRQLRGGQDIATRPQPGFQGVGIAARQSTLAHLARRGARIIAHGHEANVDAIAAHAGPFAMTVLRP